MRDHLAYDGLHDIFTDQAMGSPTDGANALTRAEQTSSPPRHTQRAAAAWKDVLFTDEVVPVSIPRSKGDPLVFSEDEGIRADTTVDSLANLRPAFSRDGTTTAGNASTTNDGAAAGVVMSKAKARELGLVAIAEIGAQGMVAGPDSTLQLQPANAIAAACAIDGIDPAALDLVEINEAFAAVGIESTRALGLEPRASNSALGLDPERVNVNGSAIAIGHPLGMSGARIALHLALELGRRGGGTGAAAICGGGGQGSSQRCFDKRAV